MDPCVRKSSHPHGVLNGIIWTLVLLTLSTPANGQTTTPAGRLVAGAHAVDITPTEFPVIVNGGFLERTADKVNDRLHARCLVLGSGDERVAIVVVDSCVLPRELLDEAKELASKSTGIATDHMMISATHTHSAPSAMGCLGTDADTAYAAKLPAWIAECITTAARKLAPARIGWTTANDPEHTHCRRWILRPDKIGLDPFGEPTIRAMMHPGYRNPDYQGPAGPVDSELSLLSVQSQDGRPIALLANYSMHYAGASDISADYCGLFAEKMVDLLGGRNSAPTPVVMMSQGTSGDQHWMDYSRAAPRHNMETIAEGLSQIAIRAHRGILYSDSGPLTMIEKRLTLGVRLPDQKRLEAAKATVARMQGRKPKDIKEVYACEQVFLNQRPQRELKLQTIRLGDLGITAIPCEVFGLTGLRIKAQSPLRPTFNISLANGEEGYIPPPAQHKLGGYTTWPARTAQLEVQAEPRIVETLLSMLEQAAGRPRRVIDDRPDPADTRAQAILASRPVAWWPMNEFEGPTAMDISGRNNHGTYEGGIAFYLDGPSFERPQANGPINPSPHFAGGRMEARLKGLGQHYTLEMWFCNYMPSDAREVTGRLFCRRSGSQDEPASDMLMIGGAGPASGKLIFRAGKSDPATSTGTSQIASKTWNHLALVRNGQQVNVYLNGRPDPEISVSTEAPPLSDQFIIAAGQDAQNSFEGRIDDVVIYDRPLPPDEIQPHWRAPSVTMLQNPETGTEQR